MTTALLLATIGRVIFGGFFAIAGIRNFLHFGERTNLQTNYGWPLPTPLLAIGFAVQLLGGVALILNLWIVPAALALIVFLFAATPLYHNVLMFKGADRDPHLYLTLVNITLCGGLLLVIADAV